MKEIIEELGLEGAKRADTPMIVSQSGKVDSDSRAMSLLDNGSPRHSLRCIDYGKSRIKPERCGYGHAQESGAISDQAADLLDALQMGSAIRQHHGIHSDWAANREDRHSVSGEMLVYNGGLLRFWSRWQKAVSLSSW